MNIISRCLISLSVLTVTACATTHPGEVLKTDKKDEVVISVKENTSLSDKYYLFLEYTVENKTSSWRDVQFVSTTFENAASEVLINEKLRSWIEGAELKMQKSRYNTGLLLGSIAAVGTVAAASSSNSNTVAVGSGAVAGSLLAATVIEINQSQQRVNSGTKGLNYTVNVPSTHIFAPIKVAPESYVRRWIVIANPTNKEKAKKGYSNKERAFEYHLVSKVKATAEGDEAKKVSTYKTDMMFR